MQVVIRSRNVELTDRLRAVATEKVERTTRYLDGMDTAEIAFSKERSRRITDSEVCEVTLHGHGHHVRAKASAADAYAAVDLVIDKLGMQLTKLKGKLVARHHQRHHHPGNWQGKGGTALLEPVDGVAPASGEGADVARIVKTKQIEVAPMSADEAALKMDLLQHDFFLFTNEETGRAAVLYRRDDGHLGLIDTAS